MPTLVERCDTQHTPETLAEPFLGEGGLVVLRSTGFDLPQARYSLVAARPFLTLRSHGTRCELHRPGAPIETHYGNPWRLLDLLLARYELPDEIDLPFPLGGAFGFWGYELRSFVETRLRARPPEDPPIPDCWVAFHDHLVVFDHRAGQTYVIATGLRPDGSRDPGAALKSADFWRARLADPPRPRTTQGSRGPGPSGTPWTSSLSREAFCAAVRRAQRYIRAGDIYQVNLAQRLTAWPVSDPWDHWCRLLALSPAPLAAYLDAGDFQLASISPELFLRLSADQIVTRPIKGTRPRAADPTLDAQLAYELQTSPKEVAELVMITDLLRNDLGRVCEYGSVQVPDLMRLERFAHVQHLVATVEGRLRPEITHLGALEACFPGGSITGAPKIRAMEIIDELEPVARGPYTGCAGYLGFNRESQLNILIRTSLLQGGRAIYGAGAGIVADSDPEAEYEETLAKARGFLSALSPGAAGSRQPETPSAIPRNP